MTHLTVAETAHPRQQEQGEGRMLAHMQHIHTATIRQVQLSQIALQTLQMQVYTQPMLKQADPIFLAGKFCVTELPPMEESKISL